MCSQDVGTIGGHYGVLIAGWTVCFFFWNFWFNGLGAFRLGLESLRLSSARCLIGDPLSGFALRVDRRVKDPILGFRV